MNYELGILFRTLRKERGLSRDQVAMRAGVSLRAIAYWEAGSREPRMEELQGALRALNLTAEQEKHVCLLLKTPRGIQLARQKVQAESVPNLLTDSVPDLGDLLAALRMRQDWTRRQLAAAMHLQYSTVARWECTQQFPTEENLDRLCRLLHAYPEERMALFTRCLLPRIREQDLSPDTIQQEVQDFCDNCNQGDSPLTDLHALALKRKLWLPARSAPQFARWLARVETHHSLWLLHHHRSEESAVCARRAIKQMEVEGLNAEPETLAMALNVASYHATVQQNGDPEAGVRFLKRHLPQVLAPKAQIHVYCDMAYYASATGHHVSALRFLQHPNCQIDRADLDRAVVMYCQMTLARVLARAGKMRQALETLPIYDTQSGRSSFHPVFVRAEMLRAMGMHHDAHDTIQTLYTAMERTPAPFLQDRVDRLARHL